MAIQNLDFGTSATNDGESLFAAFTKVEANTVALYASDGTVTHAVTDVASAATCDIGAAATDRVRITGTVTITSLGTSASKLRFVHFSGALTLTHNATSLICIGGASILTVAGDTCVLSSDADGNWRMLSFNRGASLATGDFSGPASSTDNAIVRFDLATGKLGQNSIVSIDDSGNIAPVTTDTGALGTTSLMWADLFLADGGVVNWGAGGVTATHTAASDTLTLALDAANLLASTALTVAVDGTSIVTFAGTALSPATNDVAALGTTALGWADAFFASGGTLHFANTDWVATHSTGILTVGTGDLRVTTAGTNTASVVTVGGTQNLTAKTLTSPTITTSPTAAGATWTDLGTVTTADINGGTIDGTVIGGASAAAGTFTTIGGTAITGTGLLTVSLAGNAARFLNTTDGASVQVARFEGDRATMADADEAYLSLMLSNDAGTQTEFARLTWVGTDVNAGTSVDGRLDFAVTTAGTLANELQLDGTALSPSADGGSSLGTTALGWQNLFGNTGFVLNVEGGDWVATHTAGILTVGTGDLRVTTAGTNTASAVTVGGTQTLTSKTLTAPTMSGTIALASGSVFDWNSSDVTLTHAANLLTLAGGNLTLSDTAVTVQLGTSGSSSTATPVTINMGGTFADAAVASKGKVKLFDAGGASTTLYALGVSNSSFDYFSPVDHNWYVADVGTMRLTSAALSPTTNDLLSLGTTALGWADAFFASGGTLHFANTDWVATHSTGILTVGTGDLRVTTAGTNTASVVTVGGTQTLTGKSIDLTNNTLVGSVTEFNTALEAADFYTTGGTDVAVADGGTGASTASSARTNLDTEQLGVQRGVNTQTGNYEAVAGDAGQVVEMNVAGANTFTIPPNATVAFATGTWINISQYGAGATTITPGAGVTIRNRSGLVTAGQYALATVYKRATNEWVAGGDLTA